MRIPHDGGTVRFLVSARGGREAAASGRHGAANRLIASKQDKAAEFHNGRRYLVESRLAGWRAGGKIKSR
jgi:hypothetical protein